MSTPPIEIKDLECVRDNLPLFSNLNFTAEAGTITQIGGENGAGKTSLLRIITGLAPSESGQVLWYGEPIQKKRADYLAALTFIGHLSGIKAQLNPLENLRWMVPASEQDKYFQALQKVGLKGYEKSACYTLSAGQKRRVTLARLYLERTRVWVLDEPFTAIDKIGVANLESLMLRHAESGGVVILTTHHDLQIDSPRYQQIILGRNQSTAGCGDSAQGLCDD